MHVPSSTTMIGQFPTVETHHTFVSRVCTLETGVIEQTQMKTPGRHPIDWKRLVSPCRAAW